MNNKLNIYINTFRKTKALSDLSASLLKVNLVFGLLLFTLLIIEHMVYLRTDNRLIVFTYYLMSYSITHTYILLKCYFNYKNLFNNSSNEFIANLIGTKFPGIKDKLINAYQLESNLNKDNTIEYELSMHAIDKLKSELNKIAVTFNRKRVSFLLKIYAIAIPIVVVIMIMLGNSSVAALNRLLHPTVQFEVPTPFYLENNSKSKVILDGENYEISITGYGESIPDSINLNYIINDRKQTIKIPKSDNQNANFNYTFKNIEHDMIWWGNVLPNSLFSKWDNISTDKDTIIVIKRPTINNLTFNITPPLYTKLESFTHPSNMTNIKLPYGSSVIINGSANKELNSAGLSINNIFSPFEIYNEKEFIGEKLFTETSKGEIICQSDDMNIMSQSINYNFNVIPDMKPSLSIISPENEFDLDETNKINLQFDASDDYGISNFWIEYEIKKPSYIEYQDTNQYVHEIEDFNKNAKIHSMNYIWDISGLNLATQDEIYFTVNVSDNNSFGASIITSEIFIGKYPTLEDLFLEMEEYEDNINQHNEDIVGDIDEVQTLINDLQLELLKSDELGWEEKNKLDDTIKEMENIFNQIEEISEIIDKVEEKADKNDLISDDLINKYDDFQNLLEEIITPELRDIMEKMQQHSADMNLEELLSELNNFEQSVDEFEEQLDRFIDMFEQAIAEQKIDEMIKKLESMLIKQQNIINELNSDNCNLKNIASEQRQIEEEYNNFQDVMKDAEKFSEKISDSTSKMINELINSNINKETSESIQNTRESLQKENQESSIKDSKDAQEKLSKMKDEIVKIQENFEQETVDDMMNEFFSVVNSILKISEYQDELSLLSSGIRSSSPILPEIAKKQYRIKSQNEQLMKQILELSRKTFYITPPIIRALGQSSLAMDKSISHLEQKQSRQALTEQLKISKGLNETAYLLMSSMNEMMKSGSASGFESFLKQLGDLSDKQDGLNQNTMQMPQLGMNGQKSMMQQLMEQQQTLKDGLEQLLSNMPGSENTGLGQASEDMEEVINDFKRNQVDRETIQRQQSILTRMLDSQKSLTQKDFSKKRKNEKPGENIIYDDIGNMPDNKGQQDLLLINALEQALREGHSNEYQEIIKLYFYNLQKNENK